MDFTLNSYKKYLILLLKKGFNFQLFHEYLTQNENLEKICLIRHDVDRKPENSLQMAILENKLGIKSTYYFRTKPSTLKSNIIKHISNLEHEIGYHYESLSDTNGNISEAIIDFEKNLNILRDIVPVYTCSMHGRPFKPYDNRDIWRISENHKYLIDNLKIYGEIYLDIDYNDIAYINDTGRNWTSVKSNRRDKVNSNIDTDFKNKYELLNYLSYQPHNKIVFQIHPERWTNNKFEWIQQYIKDKMINFVKILISIIRK